jgi:hypothetical protein
MPDLNRLAELVDTEFEDVTVIIDNVDRETLIVHTSGEERADAVEAFLEDQGEDGT